MCWTSRDVIYGTIAEQVRQPRHTCIGKGLEIELPSRIQYVAAVTEYLKD